MSPDEIPTPSELVSAWGLLRQKAAEFINGLLVNVPDEYRPSAEEINAAVDQFLAGASLGTIDAVRAGLVQLVTTGKGPVEHDNSFLA